MITVQNRVLIFLEGKEGIADDLKGRFRTPKISHLQLLGLQIVNGSVGGEGVSVPIESDIASQHDFVGVGVVFCIVGVNRGIAVSDDDILFRNGDSTLKSSFSGRDFNRDRSGTLSRSERAATGLNAEFFAAGRLGRGPGVGVGRRAARRRRVRMRLGQADLIGSEIRKKRPRIRSLMRDC